MAWSNEAVSARKAPRNWATIRATVLRRDGGQCQINGPRCTGRATAADHIEAGDDHRLSNLQAVCVKCHNDKTAQEGATASRDARRRDAALRRRPTRPHPGRAVRRVEVENIEANGDETSS